MYDDMLIRVLENQGVLWLTLALKVPRNGADVNGCESSLLRETANFLSS